MTRSSLLFGTAVLTSGFVLSLNAAQFKFPTQTFTVPDGFEVELVAGPPLVNRPVTADFDEQGRLYVTDSSGSNDKVDKQLQDKPHRVLRLEDTHGDGRFDKASVFADKMMFPEGCLWLNGSLYVSAPPSIWKLTDSDGDGVADQRQEWFQGKTLTGCANDLHGPYLGPDGWIYWCKGAFAKQTYERPGKPPFVTRAAHIFRARPDGTGIEPVMTGGMDNPVSVAFTPDGERILTGTFFVHPGGGQRDGLIHAIYGGVYGKDHDVLDDHKRTGDLMPIMTHHGPSASCFVLRYQADSFGTEYRDNLFACLFNLHKVTRHVLEPDGATFKTRDQDFLVSDNPDFHPTDLVEDADGSLLVVDTGGWYKICCPTSQLWKPDILGAIYRVRKTGAPRVADPRGLTIAWKNATADSLTDLLSDQRPTVVKRATRDLAQMGGAAVPALARTLKSAAGVQARQNAVWALTQIDGDAARQAVHAGITDSDATVQHAALQSISLWRDASASSILLHVLETADSPRKRVAAESLGRIGDPSAVPALLAAAGGKIDRILEHSLIYALIEIDRPQPVRAALGRAGQKASEQRAALIALDQMDGGGLEPEMVTPLLAASDPLLKQTASWLIAHHPEWAGALAGFFKERLRAADLSAGDRVQLQRQLAGFARDNGIQKLLAEVLQDGSAAPDSRLIVLRAMAGANLRETPSSWLASVEEILRGQDRTLLPAAVSTAHAWPAPKEHGDALANALLALARNRSLPSEVRLEALAAVPGGLGEVDTESFAFLRANLEASKPVMTRSTAAGTLAKARLTEDQLLALTDSIQAAGPMEVPKLLGAFEKERDEKLGLKLVAALKQSSGLAGLRPDTLRPRLTNFPSVVQQEGEVLCQLLNTDAGKQKAHLDELLPLLKEGDIRRGQVVFNSQKAACSTCHAIGYLGGNVGPDLTRIGQIRTERDLLESIVYPSASFVRSFEPVLITTKSGDDFNGVMRKDAPDEIVLATGPGTEARIAREDIVEMRPGTVSVMPGGLDEQLSKQELADLVAFLRATRW